VKPAATGPVSEVSNPTFTDLAVTPGALAPFEVPLPPPPEEPEPFPHAAAVSRSAAAPASAAARLLSLIVVTTDISWSLDAYRSARVGFAAVRPLWCAGPAPASRVVKDFFVMSGITLTA